MKRAAQLITHAFAAGAAGISFLVQPLPGSDQVFVIPIQYLLAVSLTKERRTALTKAAWSQANQLIWGGGAVRLLFGFTLGLIPVAGAFGNAITAFATTEYLGYWVDKALDSPDKPPPIVSIDSIQEAFRRLFSRMQAR